MVTTTSIRTRASGAAKWDRKFSVPISMHQSLLEEIDTVRGDIPRSVFVSRILHAHIKSEKDEEDE